MESRKQKLLTIGCILYAVSTLFSMAAMSIGTGILLMLTLVAMGGPICLWRGIVKESSHSVNRRYLLFAALLALACFISLVVAHINPICYANQCVSVNFLKDMAKAWYLFWPLFLVFVLRNLTPENRSKVLRAWLLAFSVLAVIGVIQYFTGWPRRQWIPGHETRYHATLFLGHHLSVASILIFPFFALLDQLRSRIISPLKSPLKKPLLPLPLIIFAVVFGFATFFATYSRTLWLALPIGITVWALGVLPRKGAFAVAISAIFLLVAASQTQIVQKRFADRYNGIDNRRPLWQSNVEFFTMRPITGSGWHHNLELSAYYKDAKWGKGDHFVGHAHNNFLEMLASTGLLGAVTWVVYAIFFIALLRRARSDGVSPVFAWGFFCAWIVFHINGLTQVNFWEAKVLHQIGWIGSWSLLWATNKKS